MVWIEGVGNDVTASMAVGYVPAKYRLRGIASPRFLRRFGISRRLSEEYSVRPSDIERRAHDEAYIDYIRLIADTFAPMPVPGTDLLYLCEKAGTRNHAADAHEPRHRQNRRRRRNYRRIAFVREKDAGEDTRTAFDTVLETAQFLHAQTRDVRDRKRFEKYERSILETIIALYEQDRASPAKGLDIKGFRVLSATLGPYYSNARAIDLLY